MRRLVVLPLLLPGLLGVGPIRCGDDPMPRLEAEKRELLASTVPKAEFWSAVGKKGELVKQQREVEAQGAPLDEKKAALEAQIAMAESELATARGERAKSQAALDAAHVELQRAQGEQEAREARLRAFAQRHAAGGSS